jgi:hypothetical protein
MEAVISVIIIEICELFSIKEWIMSNNLDIGVNIVKNRRSAKQKLLCDTSIGVNFSKCQLLRKPLVVRFRNLTTFSRPDTIEY